ncbi:unnamed protein product [Paramecium sonneborni]|uniref:Uncharacterized protein n=1 Tax=Paramecium sonneborni TaxID=65129 RepID=A0A8S1R4U6_9CILI|nr:unnamed protein product [Paramecium sonneborni]
MNQKKQEISTWILAHTQLAQALEEAWQEFCKQKSQEDDCNDEQEIKRQQYEKEKNIGQIVQEVWEANLEKLKQSQKTNKTPRSNIFDAECTSYNIHQEKNLGLKDITRWRLSLRDCKLDNQSKIGNGIVEIQALEFNEKDQKKKKKK